MFQSPTMFSLGENVKEWNEQRFQLFMSRVCGLVFILFPIRRYFDLPSLTNDVNDVTIKPPLSVPPTCHLSVVTCHQCFDWFRWMYVLWIEIKFASSSTLLLELNIFGSMQICMAARGIWFSAINYSREEITRPSWHPSLWPAKNCFLRHSKRDARKPRTERFSKNYKKNSFLEELWNWKGVFLCDRVIFFQCKKR